MLGFRASPSSEARSSGPGPLPARVPALALGLQVLKDKQGQARTRRGETYQQPGLNVGRADGQLQVARDGAHPLPHANLTFLLAADAQLLAERGSTALYKGSAPLHARSPMGCGHRAVREPHWPLRDAEPCGLSNQKKPGKSLDLHTAREPRPPCAPGARALKFLRRVSSSRCLSWHRPGATAQLSAEARSALPSALCPAGRGARARERPKSGAVWGGEGVTLCCLAVGMKSLK